MIKYGLKLWNTNKNWFVEATQFLEKGKLNFIELYITSITFELKDLEVLRNFPVVIHSPHCQHNFNIFELAESKIKLFKNQVIKTANYLESPFIILHSGVGRSSKIFRKNVNKIYDKRILIENMPKIGLNEKICFGYSLEQLKFIKNKCGLNICLDFTHAIKSAISQKIDYKDFIESLISELTPHYFHICGAELNSEKDEHLNLFEGDFDIRWAKKILMNLAKKRNIYLVFETPKHETLKNDMKNIDYFKDLKV